MGRGIDRTSSRFSIPEPVQSRERRDILVPYLYAKRGALSELHKPVPRDAPDEPCTSRGNRK